MQNIESIGGMLMIKKWLSLQMGKPYHAFRIDGTEIKSTASGPYFLKVTAHNEEFGRLQIYISFNFPVMAFDNDFRAEGVLELVLFSHERDLINFLSLGIRHSDAPMADRAIAALITLPKGESVPTRWS